jgi:hypothetical protein
MGARWLAGAAVPWVASRRGPVTARPGDGAAR